MFITVRQGDICVLSYEQMGYVPFFFIHLKDSDSGSNKKKCEKIQAMVNIVENNETLVHFQW